MAESHPSFSGVLASGSLSFLCPVLLSEDLWGRCPICDTADPELPAVCWFWWHWNVMVFFILEENGKQNLLFSFCLAFPRPTDHVRERPKETCRWGIYRVPCLSSQDLYADGTHQKIVADLQLSVSWRPESPFFQSDKNEVFIILYVLDTKLQTVP